MLAEERPSAPSAQLSRRMLFGAAAAVVAAPAVATAQTADLMAVHRQYEAAREAYSALPAETLEEVDDVYFDEITRLDNVIAHSPCRSRGDAQAKVLHAIRGIVEGDRGTEQVALEQVVAFLGAI